MNLYTTKDFYLVAYLFLLGNQIIEAKLVTPHTTEFSFVSNEDLTLGVAQFYSQKASVDPMSYGSAFRTVKSLIHSLKTSNGTTTSTSKELNNNDTNNRRNSN